MTCSCATCGATWTTPPFTAEAYLYALTAKRRDALRLQHQVDAGDIAVHYAYIWDIHRYLYFKRVYFAFRQSVEYALEVANSWVTPEIHRSQEEIDAVAEYTRKIRAKYSVNNA